MRGVAEAFGLEASAALAPFEAFETERACMVKPGMLSSFQSHFFGPVLPTSHHSESGSPLHFENILGEALDDVFTFLHCGHVKGRLTAKGVLVCCSHQAWKDTQMV